MGINKNRRPRFSLPVYTRRKKRRLKPYTVNAAPVVTRPLAGMDLWLTRAVSDTQTNRCGITAVGLCEKFEANPASSQTMQKVSRLICRTVGNQKKTEADKTAAECRSHT
jgi:hypothetical protein